MAVPSNGEITLLGIKRELETNNYNATNTYTNISLTDLSDGTVDTINTNSTARPNGTAPHQMSEFHAYDHDQALGGGATSFSSMPSAFSVTTNVSTTGYSDVKTATINNPSGNLTAQIGTNSLAGTMGIALADGGDPGTSGTANSGTGFAEDKSNPAGTATITNVNSGTFYFRIKFQAHSSMASGTRTITFTCNSVSTTLNVTGVSQAAPAGPGGPGLPPGFPSDRRLKTNIEPIGKSSTGIPIYIFNYKNDLSTKYKGVIAQDLLSMGITEPVGKKDGYYTVDYNKIDVDLEII